jgi:hypothetical protein
MAEFDGLDGRLRDAFAKAAEQGDSTGVADAIRSRISAGDSGTSIASSTAPGWGGGVGSWLPWIGLIVVAAIGGTAVGASGLVGAPEGSPGSGPTAVVVGTAPAASCPGGPIIDEFHAGDRVLAVQRSEESDYLGVRDPRDLSRVLWLPASVLTIDPGQPDPSTLPVGECPEIVVSYPTPTPTPEETQEPVPGPVADTTKPTIGAITMATDNCSFTATVPAADNVGVTGVTLSWTNAQYPVASGSAAMTHQGGGVWGYEFVQNAMSGYPGDYTVSATARDAAGNAATSGSVTKNVQCLG